MEGCWYFLVRQKGPEIRASSSCLGAYSYNFNASATFPDVSVKVGSSILMPDVTIKLVDSRFSADIVVTDQGYSADMIVCKGGAYSGKTIKVSNSALMPDISVRVSKSALMPDYRLYYDSDIFTLEEAAALAPAIWFLNRN